jgi:hypothetical protein
VVARKSDWLRGACLAAALLFPAVAALHGIVLAAVHNPNAVDMDIYGTFQLCTIGALAALSTARRSQTYFNAPGRNLIFVFSLIVLAGLLSLTVEFYRTDPVPCNDSEITQNTFNYSVTTCGLRCDTSWPISPIRGGSANNINVVPAPHVITPNAAMLLSAGSCIPAILLSISLLIKVHDTNPNAPKASENSPDKTGPVVTTGEPSGKDTSDHMTEVRAEQDSSPSSSHDDVSKHHVSFTKAGFIKSKLRQSLKAFRSNFEAPVFGAAILVIVVIGERNLWSGPIYYDTEPIANVGEHTLFNATCCYWLTMTDLCRSMGSYCWYSTDHSRLNVLVGC